MDASRPPLTLIGSPPRRDRPALGLELAALGTTLVFVCVLLARLPSWRSALGTFQALAAVGFACTALALWRARGARAPAHATWIVLAVAAAARLALLPVAPSLSDDVYRYVWEGRVVAHGGDPYRHAPDDPALAPLVDRVIHPRVNHPELATIYPPVAMGGFALVAALSPTVWAMKLWIVLNDLALCAVLTVWLRARGAPVTAAIAYAWNPLVLIEYAGSAHHDPTGMLWLALALLWCERRPLPSALAFVLAVFVKLLPVIALPFLWRGWSWRARSLALALLVAGGAWFWSLTRGADSGLTAYATSWRNNELVFAAVERVVGDPRTARLAVAALGLGAVLALSRRVRDDLARGLRSALRVVTLIGPTVHPWYLGWCLMFEPLAPSAPWLLLSALVLLSYGILRPPLEGGAFHLGLAGRMVEYGVPALLAVGLAWRRRSRRAG